MKVVPFTFVLAALAWVRALASAASIATHYDRIMERTENFQRDLNVAVDASSFPKLLQDSGMVVLALDAASHNVSRAPSFDEAEARNLLESTTKLVDSTLTVLSTITVRKDFLGEQQLMTAAQAVQLNRLASDKFQEAIYDAMPRRFRRQVQVITAPLGPAFEETIHSLLAWMVCKGKQDCLVSQKTSPNLVAMDANQQHW